jgi:sulfatase modifying factor 1
MVYIWMITFHIHTGRDIMKRRVIASMAILILLSSVAVYKAHSQEQDSTKISLSSYQGLPENAIVRFGKGCVNPDNKGVAFSPDGKMLAVATSIGIYLYDTEKFEEAFFFPTNEWMNSVIFSSDSCLLASYSDKKVNLWDVKSHEKVATMEHPDIVKCINFSPNGKSLVSLSGNDIFVWNLETKQAIATLRGWRSNTLFYDTEYLSFSPDGKLLASRSYENVVIWNMEKFTEITKLEHSVWSTLAFSPDCGLLATGVDNTVQLWDTKSFSLVATLQHPPGEDAMGRWEGVNTITFSHDGSLLASVNMRVNPGGAAERFYQPNGGSLRIWDVKNYKEVTLPKLSLDTIVSVSFSPDNSVLAIGCGNGEVRLWDLKSNKKIMIFKGNPEPVTSVRFNPYGNILASIGLCVDWGYINGGTMNLWDIKNLKEITLSEGYSHKIDQVSLSPDSNILAASYDNGEIILWDFKKHKEIERFKGRGHFAFNSNNTLFAYGYDENHIIIQDIKINKEVANLKCQLSPYNSLVFSPNSNFLANKDEGIGIGHIELLDIKNNKNNKKNVIFEGENPTFSDDSKILIYTSYVTGDSNQTRFWNMETLKDVTQSNNLKDYKERDLILEQDEGPMVDPYSKVIILDKRSGRTINVVDTTFLRGLDSVSAFSPNGNYLAIANKGGVWLGDGKTGEKITRLGDHSESVITVAFSSDSNILLSGSADGTILVWDIHKFAPNYGMLDIQVTPKGAQIFVDSKIVGQTPAILRLSPGTHRVEVNQTGWVPMIKESVLITRDQTELFNGALEQKMGELKITSKPLEANIVIDGKDYGFTPKQIQLPLGNYKLALSKKGFSDFQEIVNIEWNKALEINARLPEILPSSIIGKDGASMVLMKEGDFIMGNEPSGKDSAYYDAPRHRVYTKAFYIDIYEVTNAQYKKFIDAAGHKAPFYWNNPDFNAPNHPVVGITWYDAVDYAKWAGKRLPTEAEWEKAGGYPFFRLTPEYANYRDRDAQYRTRKVRDVWEYTSPVGSFYPNDYGLYDVIGNVAEWCSDWYSGDANWIAFESPKENPSGPVSGQDRVVRGGSWQNGANDSEGCSELRTSYRDKHNPDYFDDFIGFRCVMDVDETK